MSQPNQREGVEGAAVEAAASNGDAMESPKSLYVIFYDGERPIKYLQPEITAATTVRDLKKQIFVDWSIPEKYQNLKLGNSETELDDNKFLVDFTKAGASSIVLTSTAPASERPPDEPSRFVSQEFMPTSGASHGVSYGPNFATNHDFRYNNDDSDNDHDLFESRPSHGLVGLKNQGATCYLNSLIQALYLTPEFRRMIYGFPRPWDLLLRQPEKPKKGKNAKDDKGKDDKSKDDKKDAPVADDQPDRTKDIIFQMQMLFSKMQFANVSSVSTSGLTTSFGWDNSDIFVQHDVQELNRVLTDKLEEKMKEFKDAEYSIPKLYKGALLNMVQCMNCKRVSLREEDYYDISLVIKNKKDIYESLDEFTETETMKDDNAYFCEKCNSKQTAQKSIKFKTFPRILNLQLKRFEYDWERDVRVKLHDEISFPMLLDMSKYLVDPKLLQTNEDKEKAEKAAPQTEKKDEKSKKEKKEKDKEKEKETLPSTDTDLPYFELYAVLVHSGNAGFGHYYAFLKSFTDAKWYKFNDEQVTAMEESEVEKQLIGGSTGGGFFGQSSSASMQRSATPYMLVYRKKTFDTLPKDFQLPPKKKIKKLGEHIPEFKIPPIADEEIPPPILENLVEGRKKKEVRRVEREKEMNSIHVTVLRNRLELPIKDIKVDKTATLGFVLDEVVKQVQGETETKHYYRFRRVANRKNQTKRPMNLYKEIDYQKTLTEIGLDKKCYLYLEQDADEHFSGLGDIEDDKSLVSIRVWNPELKRATSLKDFIFTKTTTIGQLKQILAEKYVNMKPEEMVICEEETEKIINPMLDDKATLAKYSIISGDILHVEPLSKEHLESREKGSTKPKTFTEQYYAAKMNELILDIDELERSFKRRVAALKVKEQQANEQTPTAETETQSQASTTEKKEEKSEDLKKLSLRIRTSKDHTLRHIKEVTALHFNLDPKRLRIYARDTTGYGEGRLLKDLNGKLEKLLQRFTGSKLTTELGFDIIDQPEDLAKGDKLIQCRYYNANSEFVTIFEVLINKTKTMKDFKTKLREKTGVPEERQVISEWYNEHFYKLFSNEDETIQQCRIRKNDVLRMDAIKDASLNISNSANPVLAFQMVQFINWETTPYGRKEMQTSFPVLITIPESATIFDLRVAVANRVGIPFHNLNVATASSFPIMDGFITPVRDHTKNNLESKVWDAATKEKEKETKEKEKEAKEKEKKDGKEKDKEKEKEGGDEDPDDAASRLAEQENRDSKTFFFKLEKQVPIKKLRLRPLDILCYEDLRTKVEKASQPVQTRGAKKAVNRDDAIGIKIKN